MKQSYLSLHWWLWAGSHAPLSLQLHPFHTLFQVVDLHNTRKTLVVLPCTSDSYFTILRGICTQAKILQRDLTWVLINVYV